MPKQIVIAGAGLVTPLGLSREATWDAVRAGKCGLGPLTAIEQALPPGSTGGQAPELPTDFQPDQPREVRYLSWAIDEAMRDAKADPNDSAAALRRGIVLGTTLHGMRSGGKFLRDQNHAHLAEFLAGGTLAAASAHLPAAGFAATVCSACSSSLGSIALGVSLLRAGELDMVIAGGYDTISEYVYGGFNSLRLVASGALRPFTRDRQGMKLAEGYGIVVLERAQDAARRGVLPLATILGYGESADAHHLTQPHPQGEGAARAILAALAAAGLEPRDIDLIAAHATGTPDNDAGEYAALSRVLGADLSRPAVVAFKSHLGHTLGGAGAVELILSALCMRDQIVPACANVRRDDLEFPGLNVATETARAGAIRATLNTSLGFGGANTCMILGPAPTHTSPEDGDQIRVEPRLGRSRLRSSDVSGAAKPQAAGEYDPLLPATSIERSSANDVLITGVGVVLPGMVGNEAFARAMTAPEARGISADTGAVSEAELGDLLNARRVRRMSDYVKLSLAATMLACRDAAIADIPAFAATCSALLGSTHGSANYCDSYYGQIVREGIGGANPVLFAEGVPNAAAAHLSLMLSLKGPCQTVIGTRTAGLDALHLAALRIANGEWDRAIVGAAEEFAPLVNAAYGHWGLYRGGKEIRPSADAGGFYVGSGAVTFVLESGRSRDERGAKARGKIVRSTGPIPIPGMRARSVSRILDRESSALICNSANNSWIDRVESLAWRHLPDAAICSLRGRIAETFSVTPMAGLAAFLLTGSAPGAPPSHFGNLPKRMAVTCVDYTHLFSSATVELVGP